MAAMINNIRLVFLFLFAATILANFCNGQNKTVTPQDFDPYFVESSDTVSIHGPNCIVRDVLQDKKGNLWLATWQGIISYDGVFFTNHTLKEGLIHFHVVSVFEDTKANLWFGTAGGGLYLYNGKSFRLFTTRDGLADNTIMCMAEDKKGNIWLGTENGASCFDGKSFVNFTTQHGLSSNYVNSLLVDKAGKIWLGCDGITLYNGKTFTTLKNNNGLPFARVASLHQDKAGNIWIGSMKGLFRYDGSRVSDCILTKLAMYISEDKNGNLLLAFNDYPNNRNFALYKYDGKSFTKLLEQNDGDNWVIFGMMEDKNRNIWYGTGRGIYRYDGKSLTDFK
jgi:ligand-binding sensor domain-containing protein